MITSYYFVTYKFNETELKPVLLYTQNVVDRADTYLSIVKFVCNWLDTIRNRKKYTKLSNQNTFRSERNKEEGTHTNSIVMHKYKSYRY